MSKQTGMVGKGRRGGGWVGAAVGLAAVLGAATASARAVDLTAQEWTLFKAANGLDAGMHPQYLGSVAAWNKGDTIFFALLKVQCPASMCADCILSKTDIFRFTVPGPASQETPPFALVKTMNPPGSPISAVAIIIQADGTVRKLHANLDGTVTPSYKWDAAQSTFAGHDGIATVAIPGPDFTVPADSAAFVLGTNGLGFRLEWTRQGIRETSLHLPRYDYTARGGSYLGTASGEILRFQPFPTVKRVAQAWPARILALDSTGGLDAAGHFLYSRAGDSWMIAPDKPPAGARAWKTGFDGSGLFANVWGDSASPRLMRLPDWPTYAVPPAERRYFLNGKYEPLPDDHDIAFALDLVDEDGDFAAPVVRLLRGKDTLVVSHEFKSTVPGFGVRDDGTRYAGCADSGICLGGTRVKARVSLARWELWLKVPVMRGTVNRLCANHAYFQGAMDTAFIFQSRVQLRDSIEMIFGRDTVRAYAEPAVGIRLAGPALRTSPDAPNLRIDGRRAPPARPARMPLFRRP